MTDTYQDWGREPRHVSMRRAVAAEFGIENFTCDECPAQTTCFFAFDAYNTDGDCLAEK